MRLEVEIEAATASDLKEYARWVKLSSSLTTAEATSKTIDFALRKLFRHDRLWQEHRRNSGRRAEAAPAPPSKPSPPASSSPAPSKDTGKLMAGVEGAPAAAQTSPLLTRREAAAFCRVSLRTFERFAQGSLPAVQIGSRLLFAAEDLNRWLESRRSSAAGAPPAAATFTPRRARPPGGGALSQQEREILAHLRARRPAASPGSR